MDFTENLPMVDSFVARLDPADRAVLLAAGAVRSFPANTTLLHQGDLSSHVIILLTGLVKVSVTTASGYETMLALCGPGELLGELAAVTGDPRSASVHTLQSTSAWLITAERFVDLLHQRPSIAVALAKDLAHRLRGSDLHRVRYGAHSVHQRLAAQLLDLAERHGVAGPSGTTIGIPLSQRELASSVGASREAAARFLRDLRERDVLVTLRRKYVIRRPEVLRSIARSVYNDTEGLC
ncbi:cAMP-binding domain of CRP or a regulatory subunit of cAMP-dependent protein kinases [Goodfellowiella coeruleoviolacea]|uniref:cAMP-binding domain of CRP or a regulatory subunit of cAMP-dependent protein kinases n=2 Tax=Goodfellowiella coeruleoviolacea TaxID=334858 RepID=A0AAE3GBE4_9PSEU|nr:cAMP-binding domain of CRP or a regulatory subunit of cAMP-dependent protein kinases [Goodfellowiella coeruleoviolacea]